MRNLKIYYVYIIASKTGTLYIGVTNDLHRRIYEHRNKLIKGFTEKYNIDRLMYFQEFEDINQAIEAEKKFKKWSRDKKMNLIKTMNPDFKDLYERLI
ncbi:GIY-YIG nuclease family protein [Candidatus Daviesbacteria bacterium]|nr:GIY-YIG nuclease family protein [Candidatus Daviesbacteria bacterium]